MKAIIFALVVILKMGIAFAEEAKRPTGNDYFAICGNQANEFDCDLILVAAVKATQNDLEKARIDSFICVPNGVTYMQIARMLRLYMERNPQFLHLSMDLLALATLTTYFPCKK